MERDHYVKRLQQLRQTARQNPDPRKRETASKAAQELQATYKKQRTK